MSITPVHCPRIVKIESIEAKTPSIKLITFTDELCAKAKPGQFVMIWIPGVDEIPMSLAVLGPRDIAGVAVAKVGDATSALHTMRRGDIIGVRGPYGNSFQLVKGKVLIVGGGSGMAPLLPLTRELIKIKSKVTFIAGARTKKELLFLNELSKTLSRHGSRLIIATEDGSYGVKGLASDLAAEAIRSDNFDMVYTCGREGLMWKVFIQARKKGLPVQASLVRIMRCGIGICGSCCIGKYLVCKDGPVFSAEQLEEVKDEFGHFMRDFTGTKERLT